MKRIVLYALLIVACGRQEASTAKTITSETSRVQIIDASRPATRPIDARPADVPNVVANTYRVRPDRRAIMAVGDIYQLVTGKNEVVRLSFVGNRWQLDCGDRRAGELPEIPKFSDDLQMLTAWAAVLIGNHPAQGTPANALATIDASISRFSAPALFGAMKAADFGHGVPDAAALARLTHAMTLLNIQTFDDFGLSDPLRARALALAALSRSREPTAVAEDVAMIARAMGYQRESIEMANRLPDKSLARAWVLGTPVTPRASASRSEAFIGAAIAAANATGNNPEESVMPWLPTIKTYALRLIVRHSSFSRASTVSHLAAAAVTGELEDPESVEAQVNVGSFDEWLQSMMEHDRLSDASVAELQKKSEAALTKRIASWQSTAAPQDVIRSYYESLLYSGINGEFGFVFWSLGSAPGSDEFIKAMADDTPLQKQIRFEMSNAYAIQYQAGQGISAPSIVQHLPLLGAHTRARLLIDASASVPDRSRIRTELDDILMDLDSRPEQMNDAGTLSMSVLEDPLRRDRYFVAALEAASSVGSAGAKARFAFETGDRRLLRTLGTNSSAAPYDRALAISYLEELGEEDATFVDAQFQKLLREENFAGGTYSVYAHILNRRHAWKIKEDLTRTWLAKNPNAQPLSKAFYVSSLAGALEHQGRYAEAWKLVEPNVRVWSANIVASAVSLLQRLGRESEANELGYQMVERYPHAATRADFALVLWREHHFDEGATLFDPKKVTLASWDWMGAVPVLVNEFTSDRDIASPAFQSLIRVGLKLDLLEAIPNELLKRKESAMAFGMAEALAASRRPTAHDPFAAHVQLTAYDALKASKNAAAAHAWLREHIPDDAVLEVVSIAFQRGDYDLIAELISPRVVERKNEELEVYLAAALLAEHVPQSDPRWVTLIDSIKQRPDPPGSLPRISRYLVGLTDERTFQTYATDANWRCNVYYFIAFKSASSGDYDRALPFALAAAVGPASFNPQAWAISLLNRWSVARLKWEDVKKQRVM